MAIKGNNIGRAVVNTAKEVWEGMSQGAAPGRSFRVKGTTAANKTIKNINKAKIQNSGLTSRATKNMTQPTMARKAGNFVGGGIRDSYVNMSKKDMKFGQAIKAAHSVDNTVNGRLSKSKMAGTFVGASAAGRIATGGGVMKDKNGNTNIIGIPFI